MKGDTGSGATALAGALVALVLIHGLSFGCARAQTPSLTLAGSTSLQPFAEKWAEAFKARRPGASIHVQGGGSTAGIQAAISGAAQIGMSSRALSREEATRLSVIAVARDAMVTIVHPTNPVHDLSVAQVRDVFAGTSQRWRELGGRDASITVITREEGSGTRAAFEELVMAKRWIVASALVQDSTGAVRQMVASDPAAIGYVSVGFVDTSVKALTLSQVVPSEVNIDAGRYPLVRPFSFVIAGRPSPSAQDFIDWITGPEGRELTRREGLLPPRV